MILLANPFAAGSISLQLSFAATLGLVWLSPKLYRNLSRFYTGTSRAVRWAVNFLCANMSASVSALVFTIPLTAIYFNILTLTAPISNLLAVPAAGWNFMAGFVTVLAGFVWLPAARVLGWVCFGLVRYVLWVAGVLASAPGHAVYFSNGFLKYWLLYVYAMFGGCLLTRDRRRKYAVAGVLAAVTLALAVGLNTGLHQYGDLSVMALDVGQGESVALYTREKAVLVDCGEGTQIGIQRLSWGIQCIDAILLTHYHADHCSGLPGMLLAITKAGRTAPLHIYGPIGLERVVAGLRVIAPSLSCPIVLHEIIDDYSPFAAIGLTITPFPLRHEMPCIGYQFHLPRPALFDPIRARAQEIPVKLWSILQRGETVSMDGQTYYPHQVLGQPRRGITFVYATDTRPVPGIVRMGQDSDLMILEGMYGAEEKLPLAHKNCHMLFREAAQLARDAGTKRLLLTHFSTSIETPEEFLPNAQAVFPETTCATDGMTLTLRYPEEA